MSESPMRTDDFIGEWIDFPSGDSIHVHFRQEGQVFFREWPAGTTVVNQLVGLKRMSDSDFQDAVERYKASEMEKLKEKAR